jgi:hypothetical protein
MVGLHADPECLETKLNKTLYGSGVLLAALDAKDFIRRHGNSLSLVLDAIAGTPGVDLFYEADRLLACSSPDPVDVGMVVRRMRDLLVEAPMPKVRPVALLRWHRARLTELAGALPQ